MNKVDKIRSAALPAAMSVLACEPAAQEHPVLLLYLQNLTDCIEREADAAAYGRRSLADCWAAVGRINARLAKLEVAVAAKRGEA